MSRDKQYTIVIPSNTEISNMVRGIEEAERIKIQEVLIELQQKLEEARSISHTISLYKKGKIDYTEMIETLEENEVQLSTNIY